MTTGFVPEANGIYLNSSDLFSNSLSAAPAGSTHFLLRDGVYNIWATQPFVLVMTNAANDPQPVPATQPAAESYPGAPIPALVPFQFQMDSTTTVFAGPGPVFLVISPTGFRAFTLGGAGTFYCVLLGRRTL